MIPRTGDDRIDRYLPWYMSAGILLTKIDRTGDVLTMGYRELIDCLLNNAIMTVIPQREHACAATQGFC